MVIVTMDDIRKSSNVADPGKLATAFSELAANAVAPAVELSGQTRFALLVPEIERQRTKGMGHRQILEMIRAAGWPDLTDHWYFKLLRKIRGGPRRTAKAPASVALLSGLPEATPPAQTALSAGPPADRVPATDTRSLIEKSRQVADSYMQRPPAESPMLKRALAEIAKFDAQKAEKEQSS